MKQTLAWRCSFSLRLTKQLLLTVHTETIYLYGGWDGNQDLADLWGYHIPTQQWNCVSKNTEEEVGG